jgi:hypothetical protein
MALSIERCNVVINKRGGGGQTRADDVTGKQKRQLVFCYCFLTWLIASVISLPTMLSIDGISINSNQTRALTSLVVMCKSNWSHLTFKVYFTFKFALLYLLPVVVITVSSAKLFIFLYDWNRTSAHRLIRQRARRSKASTSSSFVLENRQPNRNVAWRRPLRHGREYFSNNKKQNYLANNRRHHHLTSRRFNHSQRARQKATRIIFALLVLFLLQWTPLWILKFILMVVSANANGGGGGVSQQPFLFVVNLVVSSLSYINIITNPIMYMLISAKFRKNWLNFCHLFGCLDNAGHCDCQSRRLLGLLHST